MLAWSLNQRMKLRPCRAANLPVDIQALPLALTESTTDRQSHQVRAFYPTLETSAARYPIFSRSAFGESPVCMFQTFHHEIIGQGVFGLQVGAQETSVAAC